MWKTRNWILVFRSDAAHSTGIRQFPTGREAGPDRLVALQGSAH
jgi:hypothetical protein